MKHFNLVRDRAIKVWIDVTFDKKILRGIFIVSVIIRLTQHCNAYKVGIIINNGEGSESNVSVLDLSRSKFR